MTEQELQQYLKAHYPKENEGCEWKEFKNQKNDFNGKEKEVSVKVYARQANISKNQDFILLALQRDPHMTIPELSELVGISERNISENLKKLQARGLLERVGSRKKGYWKVNRR